MHQLEVRLCLMRCGREDVQMGLGKKNESLLRLTFIHQIAFMSLD